MLAKTNETSTEKNPACYGKRKRWDWKRIGCCFYWGKKQLQRQKRREIAKARAPKELLQIKYAYFTGACNEQELMKGKLLPPSEVQWIWTPLNFDLPWKWTFELKLLFGVLKHKMLMKEDKSIRFQDAKVVMMVIYILIIFFRLNPWIPHSFLLY